MSAKTPALAPKRQRPLSDADRMLALSLYYLVLDAFEKYPDARHLVDRAVYDAINEVKDRVSAAPLRRRRRAARTSCVLVFSSRKQEVPG